MALARCIFCTTPPVREVAVSRWRTDPDDRERLTVWLCTKHLQRVQKAGNAGYAHQGLRYKEGFW